MKKIQFNRFMVYLKNQEFCPSDAKLVLKKAKELTSSLQIVIRDCRISKNFIELDISIPKINHIDKVLTLLEKISPTKEVIEVKERVLNKNKAIDNAIFFFNQEKYWWAHEALEMVWKDSIGDEKQLLNGLILVCAAFVHNQKDEYDICLSILERSMIKFSNVKESFYYKISINDIKIRVTKILQEKKIAYFKI